MNNPYDIFRELKKANENYQRLFHNQEIDLTMEDDSVIGFYFHESNTPHLLGIQSTYYSKRRKEFSSIYRFMEHLLTNQDEYIKKLHNTEIYFTDLFAPTILKKLKAFNSITSLTEETFAFLIEFSPYIPSDIPKRLSDYYIYVTADLRSFKGFLIGIDKQGHPITLINIDGLKKLKRFIGDHPLELIKEVSLKQRGTYNKQYLTSSEEALRLRREELQKHFTVKTLVPQEEQELESPETDVINTQAFQIDLLEAQLENAETEKEDREEDIHELLNQYYKERENARTEKEDREDYIHGLLSQYYSEREETKKVIAKLQNENAQLIEENAHPISTALKRLLRRKKP